MVEHEQSADPADKSVTHQHIAERCGVTQATVSRAFQRPDLVKAATRERILAVAAELGYDPALHETARRLALHRHGRKIIHHAIGLTFLTYLYKMNYYSRLYEGIMEGLAGLDYALLMKLLPHRDAIDRQVELPAIFWRGDIDGLLFCPGTPKMTLQQIFHHPLFRQCPKVGMLVRDFPGCSMVIANERQGAYQATKHLLAWGHRQFLHVIGYGENLDNRLTGVRRALLESALPPAQHLHLFKCHGNWYDPLHTPLVAHDDEQQDATQLLRYLRAHPQITALLALNDANAINIWYALNDAGYDIPLDYSLIGFDNTDPLPGARGGNLLTSVSIPLQQIGKEAVRLLIRQIEAPSYEWEELSFPPNWRSATRPPSPLLVHAQTSRRPIVVLPIICQSLAGGTPALQSHNPIVSGMGGMGGMGGFRS